VSEPEPVTYEITPAPDEFAGKWAIRCITGSGEPEPFMIIGTENLAALTEALVSFPPGWRAFLVCGHTVTTRGRAKTKSYISCRECQTQRRVLRSDPEHDAGKVP
jgi:hypothetical protein